MKTIRILSTLFISLAWFIHAHAEQKEAFSIMPLYVENINESNINFVLRDRSGCQYYGVPIRVSIPENVLTERGREIIGQTPLKWHIEIDYKLCENFYEKIRGIALPLNTQLPLPAGSAFKLCVQSL